MQKKIIDPLLILASSSPRRKELLKKAGLTFSVVPSNFDEQSVSIGSHEAYACFLAKEKATDISKKYPGKWVLGADTIVVCSDERVEKPKSKADAKKMLNLLSGKKHQVITGYAVNCISESTMFSEAVTTDVYFKCLTDKEIQWYINSGEPFGKAGAYAIQGLGSRFVKAIDGSYTNVVGLPVYEVIEFLLSKHVI